jgi:ribosomal protein L37E
MNDLGLTIRCQRCGAEMELRDPAAGMAWTPDQFWVCNKCGRHFWTTYPPPKKEEPKPVVTPAPAATVPTPAAGQPS